MVRRGSLQCAKCGITSRENSSLIFHRFPSPSLYLKAKVWATYCYPNDDWTSVLALQKVYKQHKFICGNHFDDTAYTNKEKTRLNKFAIPAEAEDLWIQLGGQSEDPRIKEQVTPKDQEKITPMDMEITASTSQASNSIDNLNEHTLQSPDLTKETMKSKGIPNKLDVKKNTEFASRKNNLHVRKRKNLTEMLRLKRKFKELKKCNGGCLSSSMSRHVVNDNMHSNTATCTSCNIVICEVLTFIQNKLEVMDEENLVRVCMSAFSVEDIDAAKSLLFDSMSSAKLKISANTDGNSQQDLQDIIRLFKETDRKDVPVFVARELQKLPPFTLDIDASTLQKDILAIQNDLHTIKTEYATLVNLKEVKQEMINLYFGNNQLSENESGIVVKLCAENASVMSMQPPRNEHSDELAKESYILVEPKCDIQSLSNNMSSPAVTNPPMHNMEDYLIDFIKVEDTHFT